MNATKFNLNIKSAIFLTLVLLLAQATFSLVILVPLHLLGRNVTNGALFNCLVFLLSFGTVVSIITVRKSIKLPFLLRFDKAEDIYFIFAVGGAVLIYFLVSRYIIPILINVAPKNNFFFRLFLLNGDNSYTYLLLALIIAPFTEELFFRGIVLRGMLGNVNQGRAILISAVLFAIYHCNPYLFVPTFVIGLSLGYLYSRSGSIIPCIVMHAVYNLCFRLEVYFA